MTNTLFILDPTRENHPLRLAMVKAIAFEHLIASGVITDASEADKAWIKSVTDDACLIWQRAVDAYRAQKPTGRPSALPGKPRSIVTG